jgi:transposase-like protein
MKQARISYKNHRFPPQVIAHAVWLYFRFPLSLRHVEEMLLERGIVVSYETIRRWVENTVLIMPVVSLESRRLRMISGTLMKVRHEGAKEEL